MNRQITYDRMLAQLSQCEFAITKSDFASKMMKQELKNYEVISQTIDSGIEHAKSQIEQSKENLVLAKKIRKHRMEYDVLAKIITQQPDRKKTTEKLEALKKDLSELENNRRQLQRKLEIRRNEFSVLMRSIKELQTKLDDENEENDSVSSGTDEEVLQSDADVVMAEEQPSFSTPVVSSRERNEWKVSEKIKVDSPPSSPTDFGASPKNDSPSKSYPAQ